MTITETEHHVITGEFYEFSLGAPEGQTQPTHIGLHVINGNERTTIAFTQQDAEAVGKLLVAHADYMAGKPPRQW
ncbi:MAG TPA: hypothetical protein VFR17_00005 [Mycobacterium sp.]|nr:hypothetical protein [Mycobacterium sp.]